MMKLAIGTATNISEKRRTLAKARAPTSNAPSVAATGATASGRSMA